MAFWKWNNVEKNALEPYKPGLSELFEQAFNEGKTMLEFRYIGQGPATHQLVLTTPFHELSIRDSSKRKEVIREVPEAVALPASYKIEDELFFHHVSHEEAGIPLPFTHNELSLHSTPHTASAAPQTHARFIRNFNSDFLKIDYFEATTRSLECS
jgi:hypothetical protein